MSVDDETPRVLIAGGGPAGLEALIALRRLASERVSLTLLAPTAEFAYRPLAVAEPFGAGAARRYDLSAIAADHGAEFVTGELERVDSAERRVHLADGREVAWDLLLVAVGARAEVPFPDAVTILGPDYTSRFRSLLDDLVEGRARQVAFVVPPGVAWALPLYELALMTAAHLAAHGVSGAELSLVTPEWAPLEIFGNRVSEEVQSMLEARGVGVHAGCYPSAVADGQVTLMPASAGSVKAERVVSLPVLSGPELAGLPHDPAGFIPVDLHGLVEGETDVYAAGDVTPFPVKQGGIATQEADAVAEAIAARVGAPVDPEPFRPVLRGMLLTGEAPRYMRAEISGGRGEDWEVTDHALWWPPSKIAGRYLSPYLGLRHADIVTDPESRDSLAVEVELEQTVGRFRRRAAILPDPAENGPRIQPIGEGSG